MATRAVLHDPNLNVDKAIVKDGLVFYRIDSEPFRVHGLLFEGDRYRRLPEAVARATNAGVTVRHTNTAGGRVRFVTDSSRIAIMATMENICLFPHCALTGTGGFDLYVGKDYINSYPPPVDMETGYESCIHLEGNISREITIHFPTYADVKALYIGLEEGASLSAPSDYRIQVPVVYYGTSITQGGCASRPGISYEEYISRRFDCDYWNLGFSGSCRAEPSMIEYIKKLTMSCFVYDYDHNAPTADYLEQTHERLFLAVRKEQPDLPVILMSRPKYVLDADEQRRRAIIKATYDNAVARGDRKVFFLDGPALFALCGREGLVDNAHPNDLGFFSMAKALGDLMEENAIFG